MGVVVLIGLASGCLDPLVATGPLQIRPLTSRVSTGGTDSAVIRVQILNAFDEGLDGHPVRFEVSDFDRAFFVVEAELRSRLVERVTETVELDELRLVGVAEATVTLAPTVTATETVTVFVSSNGLGEDDAGASTVLTRLVTVGRES